MINCPLKTVLITLIVIICISIHGCSLRPNAWTPPKKPELTGPLEQNELLGTTEWIDLNGWYGPEDIAIDAQGNFYTGVHVSESNFSQGSVIKIDKDGNVSEFSKTGTWIAGLHFDNNGNLIACDTRKGLISINKNGDFSILASEDENGNKFLMANDVDIASDGMIYFSNSSSRFHSSESNIRKLIMEVIPDGGLYRYNPKTKKIKTLIDGTYFGNGVALSKNNDFVLLVDLAKYRVRRYWLKGDKKGQTDIFIDNLPGFPNGISRGKDGNFWLAFSTIRSDMLDSIHSNPTVKKIVYALPDCMQPKQVAFGMIMKLSETGMILKTYYDTSGKTVSEVSSVEEHDGYLYLGGDRADHIGKYKLE